MGDIFWNVATSYFALGIDGLLLLAAAVVGFFPLVKYLPGIGSYVPAARLVAVLVAGLMCFLVGFRVADGRDEAKNLRINLEAKTADLQNTSKSLADETARADKIETAAKGQHDADAEYIGKLEASKSCEFDPFRRAAVGVPNRWRGGAGILRSLAPASAGPR